MPQEGRIELHVPCILVNAQPARLLPAPPARQHRERESYRRSVSNVVAIEMTRAFVAAGAPLALSSWQ